MKKLLAQLMIFLADGKLKTKELVELSKTLFQVIKDYLLKRTLVKFLSYIPLWMSGPMGTAARFTLSILIDKTLSPIYDKTIRKIIVKIKSKKIIKKGKAHEASKTESDFDDSFDDIS